MNIILKLAHTFKDEICCRNSVTVTSELVSCTRIVVLSVDKFLIVSENGCFNKRENCWVLYETSN